MIYVYNYTDSVCLTLEGYIADLANTAGKVYQAMFLVNLSGLFEAAKKRTSLRGRFAKTDKGEPLLESLEMTADEQDFMDETARRVAPEVLTKMMAWAKKIDQPYKYNVSFNHPYSTSDKFIIYTILLDPTWDMSTIQGVDQSILNALISGILKKWYRINRYMEDYAIEEEEYAAELDKIRSDLLQTRLTVRRPTDFFSNPGRNDVMYSTFEPVSAAPPPTGTGSGVRQYEFNTGPLIANTMKMVPHDQGMTEHYTIGVYRIDSMIPITPSYCYYNAATPADAIDIKMPIDMSEGLRIIITGQ